MPNVAIIGSMTTGMPLNANPTIVPQGSSNVIANGAGISTIGMPIVPHYRYGDEHPHGGVISQGSSTVIVNGVSVAHVGSMTSCGDTIANGAPTVIVGV